MEFLVGYDEWKTKERIVYLLCYFCNEQSNADEMYFCEVDGDDRAFCDEICAMNWKSENCYSDNQEEE